MIYFISNNCGKVKIGSSSTERTYENRMKTYKTHNPDTIVLDINEFANIDDEHNIKLELKDFRIGRSEWYYNIPEIHDVWARYKKLSLERIKENKIQSEENQLENKE